MFIFLLPLQQGDGEFASLAWLAFHIEHSIMLKNDLTCDGKADAKPAVEFIAAFFEMEEAVEDARSDLGGNTDSTVFHRNQHTFPLFYKSDFHFTPWRTEFNGIIDQGGHRT
jgi:hypothetical protein